MAVAAHHCRRSGHEDHAARRRRHRLRHHLRRAGPHVAGDRRATAFAASTPRPAPSCDSLPSNDEVLADAIETFAGRASARPARDRDAETQADAAHLQTGFAVRGPDPRAFLVTFPGLLRNVPPIEEAAAGRGLFSINPETRRHHSPRPGDHGGARRAGAVAEPWKCCASSPAPSAILVRVDDAGVQAVAVPGLEVPTDRNGQFWVHFNKHDPARYVSAKDVLQGNVPRGPIARPAGADRHVGDRAARHQDHAGRRGDAGRRGARADSRKRADQIALVNPNYAIGAELVIACCSASRSSSWRRCCRRPSSWLLGALLIAGLIGLSLYLFVEHNLLIDFTYPLISSWLIYLVLTFVNYFREQKQRQQIRSAFGYYLSPHMVEQLARSPEKLVLGGEERRMTILFSDVRGFTTISEHYKDDPQGLTRLMNRFLTPLTNAIIERKGTIDKYIGDAIMAFWNAPVDDPEQEAQCLRGGAADAGARRRRSTASSSARPRRNGGDYMPLRIGIGLNTGPCVVGNMGSDFRFNYSVLGDTVNVASRLEARTKDYRLPMVIGSRTAEMAKEKFATMEIDLIQVKGKKQPEAVFTVLGRAEVEQDPRCRELRDLNAQMLARFRKQDWDEALDSDRALPQDRQRLRCRGALRHVRRAHRHLPRRSARAGLGRRLRSGIEVERLSATAAPAARRAPAAHCRQELPHAVASSTNSGTACGSSVSSTSVSQRLSRMIQSPSSRTAATA